MLPLLANMQVADPLRESRQSREMLDCFRWQETS
jgi:hypothetical protein